MYLAEDSAAVRCNIGWQTGQVTLKAIQVGRLVDVVPTLDDRDAQTKCARLRHRLGKDARRAPVDVLEDLEMRRAHADQVVAAVGARADAEIALSECCARRANWRSRAESDCRCR